MSKRRLCELQRLLDQRHPDLTIVVREMTRTLAPAANWLHVEYRGTPQQLERAGLLTPLLRARLAAQQLRSIPTVLYTELGDRTGVADLGDGTAAIFVQTRPVGAWSDGDARAASQRVARQVRRLLQPWLSSRTISR